MSGVDVDGGEPELVPGVEQPSVAGDGDEFGVGELVSGRAVHGVVAAQREAVCQDGGLPRERVVDLDDVDLVPQVVHQDQRRSVLSCGESLQPSSLRECGGRLYVEQPAGNNSVGVLPDSLAEVGTRFGDQQRDDRGGVQVGDQSQLTAAARRSGR